MIDFEYAAEREEIERFEFVDVGVSPDPATPEDLAVVEDLAGENLGADPAATVTDDGATGGMATDSEDLTLTLPADSLSFDLGSIEFLPGGGFTFDFGSIFG